LALDFDKLSQEGQIFSVWKGKDFWILKIEEFPDNQEPLSSRRQATYKYNKFLEYLEHLVVGERIDKDMLSLLVNISAHFVMCACVNAESDPIPPYPEIIDSFFRFS
jgi:hypothetical protein